MAAAHPTQTTRFNPKALIDAMDAQRSARKMSWAEVSRAIGVAASTIKGMEKRASIETDGVLAMVRWLGREIEDFCGGGVKTGAALVATDWQSSRAFNRFNTKSLYDALDKQRRARAMTWRQVAHEIGLVSATNFSQLARGGRIDLYRLLPMVSWLGVRVKAFTHITNS